MKELNITGSDGPFYGPKCDCLRICTDGPICVVYPRARGIATSRRRMRSGSFRSISSAARLSRICALRRTRWGRKGGASGAFR